MAESKKTVGRGGGLRERKRQETFQRITEAALGLFKTRGFDATTLDAIAEAAGISRRTFFHYFKSKDDILMSTQTGLGDSLAAALEHRRPDARPLEALREAMLALLEVYAPDELVALDRMMLSSKAVQVRKQATYLQDEKILAGALRHHWPQEDPTALRLIAMLSVGVVRIAMENWRLEQAREPLGRHVANGFKALEQSFATRTPEK